MCIGNHVLLNNVSTSQIKGSLCVNEQDSLCLAPFGSRNELERDLHKQKTVCYNRTKIH